MYTPEVVAYLTAEPISLADAKEFCAIDADYTGDDALLTGYIKAARKALEGYLNLSLVATTRKLYTDKAIFELPYGPVISIASVKDKDGQEVEYDSYGSLYPKLDVGAVYGGVTVEYTAGFQEVEEDLILALKYFVRGLYDHDQHLIEKAKDLSFPYSKNLFL